MGKGKQGVKVAVMGCGTVGSGVIKMIGDNIDALSRATGEEIKLAYALDLREIQVPEGTKWTSRFDDLIEDGELDIVVETIGGATLAYKFTKALLERGISVATSNKELVVSHGAELMEIAHANGAHYLYEAAVGGGVPIIRPLRTDLAGNRIVKICGIVNGSTNYLLTRMTNEHANFDTILKEAQALGYMEANPAADVEGWDACRKLAILAHSAFGASMSDWTQVPVEGIQRITDRDIDCATAMQGTIKLIAAAECEKDGWTGWVNPALLRARHPLGRVDDVFNGILVTGDAVDEVMFYGRGAGSMPTASAVIGDVIELSRGMKHIRQHHGHGKAFVSPDDLDMRFMLRLDAGDVEALRQQIIRAMPGAEIVKVKEDLCAMMTPLGRRKALLGQIAAIEAMGISVGAPIVVM